MTKNGGNSNIIVSQMWTDSQRNKVIKWVC